MTMFVHVSRQVTNNFAAVSQSGACQRRSDTPKTVMTCGCVHGCDWLRAVGSLLVPPRRLYERQNNFIIL